MFSRTSISHLKLFRRSIQNTGKSTHNLKLYKTVVLRTYSSDGKQLIKIEDKESLKKTVYSRIVEKFFMKKNIGTLGAAVLAINDDLPDQPKGTTIISDVADKAASRILDPVSIKKEHVDATLQSPFDDPTIIHPSQVAHERVTEANGSTENISVSGNIPIDPIPEPPPIPEIDYIPVDEVVEQLNALGQPTFASMGLGGWSPVGLIQNCFEFLNVTMGVPWWGAIAIGTVVIRLLMFPLVIISQKNAAKMNNNLPGLQALQLKLTEARQCGNQLEAAKYSQEMMIFMKEKELNPLKNMLVPLAQMPVFVSFFISLRQMANVPVDSLKSGGILWFTDLTLPDQYFLLPIITSATLLATIELGADSAKLSSQNAQMMKYALRALPVIVFPFTINFPGAILVYWASSNFVSLLQVGFLRIPKVRDFFKIEKQIKIDPGTLPIKPKGFKEGVKESWTNLKIAKELEERRRLDALQFQRAGKGPIVKTYKYDPTKEISPSSSAAISAKKR